MTTTPAAPFRVRPRRPGEEEPDLTGFVLIHRAMRSGSRLVGDVCRRIASGEACPSERRQAIHWYAAHVMHEIHAHHAKEDDVLWPVIVASAGDRIDLAPLTEEHRALAGLLTPADVLVERLAHDVTAAGALGEAMITIADELDQHIIDEEAAVFPVMREHVSARDFQRCEKLFQKGTPLAHMVFLLPWVVDQCTAAERAELMPKAPPPLRLLLRLVEGRWTRRQALVRG